MALLLLCRVIAKVDTFGDLFEACVLTRGDAFFQIGAAVAGLALVFGLAFSAMKYGFLGNAGLVIENFDEDSGGVEEFPGTGIIYGNRFDADSWINLRLLEHVVLRSMPD